MIEEISNFDFLYNLDTGIKDILFDVEETILKKNIYYMALSDQKLNRIFLSMCADTKISEIMYYGKNFKRYLTDGKLPQIIQHLKNEGRRVFALTTGYPSALKRKRLDELGIFFDDTIYAYGQPKGPVLLSYIKRYNLDGDFCFIDNHLEKIDSVEKVFLENFFEKGFKLYSYLYKSTPRVINITTEKFVDYWSQVINFVRKKSLKHLKRRVNRKHDVFDNNVKIVTDLITDE